MAFLAAFYDNGFCAGSFSATLDPVYHKRVCSMYKARHIQGEVARMAQLFKVILVTGARQVGKTTLLEHVFPGAKVITFDPLEDVLLARQDPEFFFRSQPKHIILDEIQYAPELLPTLKRVVDKDPGYGQYFLTGSHNLSLLKSVSESLAGRVGIIDLVSMTTYELTDRVSFDEQNEPKETWWIDHYLSDPEGLSQKVVGTSLQSPILAMWRGGLPGGLHIPDRDLGRYFASYAQTYVQRDIRAMGLVNNVTEFTKFVKLVAAATGKEVNKAEFGRSVGVDARTAGAWLSILQQTYQWYELLPFTTNNLSKKIISTRVKGFFSDTGFACHLLRIMESQALSDHDIRGHMFETLVINTIRTLLKAGGDKADMFYWRTKGGAEVDLVLQCNGALYPIEIKCKATIAGTDLSGLRAFRETYGETMNVKPAVIVYAGTDCVWVDKDTIAVPWNAVCSD